MFRKYAKVDGIRIVLGIEIFPAFNLCNLTHSLHEENSSKDNAYFDRYNEVEDDCECKGDKKHDDVALG